jgi:hypothetical protein
VGAGKRSFFISILLSLIVCTSGALVRPAANEEPSTNERRREESSMSQHRREERIAVYRQLENDIMVSDQVEVLDAKLVVPVGRKIDLLLESDGRYFPFIGKSLGTVQLFVDSAPVGNASTIDWRNSSLPAQHSFNAIASISLRPGTHRVSLVASNFEKGSEFKVGAGSNLMILESSAKRLVHEQLSRDSRRIAGVESDVVQINPFLSLGPVYGRSAFLLSGRVYWNGTLTPNPQDSHFGDAMVGISHDRQCPSTADQSWSVNDMFIAAELQAPVYSQAISISSRIIAPDAIASVFPYKGIGINDLVYYKIGVGTTFIGIENPNILGAAYNKAIKNVSCDTQAYVCFGSTPADYSKQTPAALPGQHPWPGCPSLGETFILAETDIDIPDRHDGVLMVLAKTRVQADKSDQGGAAFIGINVDGTDRGSTGVQELRHGDTVSQRTVAASYLASGDERLAPGRHHVVAWMKAVGGFIHISANKDLSVLYFD